MDPPTFDGAGEVVTTDFDNVLLVQVRKLNEQACANGKVATSVAWYDLLADVAQSVHDERSRAAPSARDR